MIVYCDDSYKSEQSVEQWGSGLTHTRNTGEPLGAVLVQKDAI